MKHQGIFSFVIIFYILTTLSLDNVWTLLGENCCWSLLRLKGLIGEMAGFEIETRDICNLHKRALQLAKAI